MWHSSSMRASDGLVAVLAAAVAVGLAGEAAAQGSIRGAVKATGVRRPDNVVVYLKSVPGSHPPPSAPAIMDQKDFVFLPHVLPIVRGTKVRFLNSEPKAQHNVFSPDAVADKVNLGTYPPGQSRDHVFNKTCGGKGTCVAALLCNVHPEMSAYIVILENPYFAVTDKGGAFEIRNVPPGTYELVAWHEKLKEASTSVTVGAGETQVSLSLSR
ncbi:MAG: carboxypeptidase regulatory-like domain-containing protein [Deltaproteobacteria bacterium]|nr:carboxypeptidase regulatory-like domain-containing protein [Deltaproteobacteria bacterium]